MKVSQMIDVTTGRRVVVGDRVKFVTAMFREEDQFVGEIGEVTGIDIDTSGGGQPPIVHLKFSEGKHVGWATQCSPWFSQVEVLEKPVRVERSL